MLIERMAGWVIEKSCSCTLEEDGQFVEWGKFRAAWLTIDVQRDADRRNSMQSGHICSKELRKWRAFARLGLHL